MFRVDFTGAGHFSIVIGWFSFKRLLPSTEKSSSIIEIELEVEKSYSSMDLDQLS